MYQDGFPNLVLDSLAPEPQIPKEKHLGLHQSPLLRRPLRPLWALLLGTTVVLGAVGYWGLWGSPIEGSPIHWPCAERPRESRAGALDIAQRDKAFSGRPNFCRSSLGSGFGTDHVRCSQIFPERGNLKMKLSGLHFTGLRSTWKQKAAITRP